MKQSKAFTLVEIMVAIAIIGILAAAILVSMSSFGAKARSSKALVQLSSTVPSLVSCCGNGGTPNDPDPDGDFESDGSIDICSLGSSYGKWPSSTEGDLQNYRYTSANVSNCSNWLIRFNSTTAYDDVSLCCNYGMKGCKILGDYTQRNNCTGTLPAN